MLTFGQCSFPRPIFYRHWRRLPLQPKRWVKVILSDKDVFDAFTNLNSDKAMWIDGISPKVLKYCAYLSTNLSIRFFSLCLSQNCMLREWKTHKVRPLFKSGDRTMVKNYRPISLLCSVSKVFERLIYDKISDFVLKGVSHAQFGFLLGHSCLQQSLLFLRSVIISQEWKSQQDVVYLDIKKAFDKIPHWELLIKLHQVRIVGNLWNLFKNT